MTQLLKSKTQMTSIWAKACMLIIVCVLPDLHDYPSLVEGESHGVVYYYYYYNIIVHR